MANLRRNYDNIVHGRIRKEVDPIFNELVDELDHAFYDRWRRDMDFNYYGYTKQSTLEENRAQFNRIHGALHLLHRLILDRKNDQLEEPYTYTYFDEELNEYIIENAIKESADKARLELQTYIVEARDIKAELEERLNMEIY